MNVKRSLGIELIKLKRPGNYIIAGLTLLVLCLISFISLKMSMSEDSHATYASYFSSTTAQAIASIKFFIALFIMMNIGKEFTERTLRKNIIDGVTRDEFYNGKLFLMLFISLSVFLLVCLIFLTGGMFSGHFTETVSLFTSSFLIYSFFRVLFAAIFGFFLIWITQSLSASIVIYFVWSIVEQLLVQLERAVFKTDMKLENYLPLSSIERIFNTHEEIHTNGFVAPVLYIFLMLFIPYYILMKRDIK